MCTVDYSYPPDILECVFSNKNCNWIDSDNLSTSVLIAVLQVNMGLTSTPSVFSMKSTIIGYNCFTKSQLLQQCQLIDFMKTHCTDPNEGKLVLPTTELTLT